MGGWLAGCMDVWQAGWRDGWMDVWLVDGWMNGWMAGWLEGWRDGWVDGGMGGWMDGWIHGWMYVHAFSEENIGALQQQKTSMQQKDTGLHFIKLNINEFIVNGSYEHLNMTFGILENPINSKNVLITYIIISIILYCHTNESKSFLILFFSVFALIVHFMPPAFSALVLFFWSIVGVTTCKPSVSGPRFAPNG